MIVVQIYVDNIVFGSTSEIKSRKFFTLLQNEFETRMIDKLNYFLGLHVKHIEARVFISQAKYEKNPVKEFGLEHTKTVKTLMATFFENLQR